MKRNRILVAVFAALAIGLSAPVMAASTVASELDEKSQDFSSNPKKAAVFTEEVLSVAGYQNKNNDSDFLVFDGFASGTKSLDFTFTNDQGEWGSFNLRIKETAFANKHDWWPLVLSKSVSNVSDNDPYKVSYALNGYTGPLYVAIDFFRSDYKNANGLGYLIQKDGYMPSISLSSAPAPAGIPLPAGLPMILGALGALGAVRKFSKSRKEQA